MSFDFRVVKDPSNDPILKYVSNLQKIMSKFVTKSQIDQLEGSEDIFGDLIDTDSAIKFQTNLNSTHTFTFDKYYYSPKDLQYVAMWLRGYNMQPMLRDFSADDYEGGHIENWVNGEPILVNGFPFDNCIDDGSTIKSRALRFNRPTSSEENQEHIGFDDLEQLLYDKVTIEDNSIGMTYFMRVRVFATNQQGGKRRTFFCKQDDLGTPDDAVRFSIDDQNKRWVIQWKKGGVFVSKETAAQTCLENHVYDVFITLKFSDMSTHIYVGKVDGTTFIEDDNMTELTLSNSGYGEEWSADDQDAGGRIFKRGPNAGDGHVYGDLYDWKIYDDKVLTFNTAEAKSTGTALLFDGVNDSVSLGNDAALWSKALSKFSFSYYVFPTKAADGVNNLQFVRHGNTAHGFENNNRFNNTSQMYFLMHKADNSTVEAFGNGLVLNKWNIIVCTYDNSLGSANGKVYVNGVLGSQTFNLTETINSSNNMELGGPSTDLKGYMKDFRYWDNLALNQSQVDIMMLGRYPTTQPKYWLRCMEGSGNPVDVISGTKVGTLTNGTTWIVDEIGNHWINKWSISPIPRGHVLVTNHGATRKIGGISYTPTSYTSTSYNV